MLTLNGAVTTTMETTESPKYMFISLCMSQSPITIRKYFCQKMLSKLMMSKCRENLSKITAKTKYKNINDFKRFKLKVKKHKLIPIY